MKSRRQANSDAERIPRDESGHEGKNGQYLSVSEYSTFRAGIFKASIRSPSYPSASLSPRSARFRFAWQDHRSSTMPIRLNFLLPRDTGAIRLRRACSGSDSARWLGRSRLQIRTAEKIGKARVGAQGIEHGVRFDIPDAYYGVVLISFFQPLKCLVLLLKTRIDFDSPDR